MTQTTMPLNRLATDLLARLPVISAEEQRLTVEIYHQLAKGRAVTSSRLAQTLRISPSDVEEFLKRPNLQSLTYRDKQRRIVGFGGLAVQEMPHRLTVDGRTLFAWCAWDSLFIPGILGRSADVSSPTPDGATRTRLRVAPGGVEELDPQSAVMSFLLPTAATFQADALKAMASFCHFIFFFPNTDVAAAWTASRPDTSVVSVSDAFELGRRMITSRYGSALKRGEP